MGQYMTLLFSQNIFVRYIVGDSEYLKALYMFLLKMSAYPKFMKEGQ